MIDLHLRKALLALLKGLQARFRRPASPLSVPPAAEEEVLEEPNWPEDPERRFTLAGTCEACGAQDQLLNFWHFCRPCLDEMDAAERTERFDFEGVCHGCGCRSTSLNRWNLCRACTQNPDRQTLPIQPD
ncbi:hypothetical protein [Deinococcus petrolearius]|uniref:Uncharacterized protein n=1 Tax=Deinococcus petrolearius TaxID=1751295 RepID=A0ABW1DMF9_9DEIO